MIADRAWQKKIDSIGKYFSRVSISEDNIICMNIKANQKKISNTSDLYANNMKTCTCAPVSDAVDKSSSKTIGIHKKPCVAVREYPVPFLGYCTGKNNTKFA